MSYESKQKHVSPPHQHPFVALLPPPSFLSPFSFSLWHHRMGSPPGDMWCTVVPRVGMLNWANLGVGVTGYQSPEVNCCKSCVKKPWPLIQDRKP